MQTSSATQSRLETRFVPQAKPTTDVLEVKGVATYREASQLRAALQEAIEASGDKNLVVALHAVERMDTAAMAVLVEGLKKTHDRGPDMYLIAPSESVLKVFQLAGLEDALVRCFHCMDDLQQAMAG